MVEKNATKVKRQTDSLLTLLFFKKIKMCLLNNFTLELHQYLTGNEESTGNIIRKHTNKLDQLSDISFPLDTKIWLNHTIPDESHSTILHYLSQETDTDILIAKMIEQSRKWTLQIADCKIISTNQLHLRLNRPKCIDLCIKEVLNDSNYGWSKKIFPKSIKIDVDGSKDTLTGLRMIILQQILQTLVQKLTNDNAHGEQVYYITSKSNENDTFRIISGPVLNEKGVKDVETSNLDIYERRTTDMQLMAQHKYGVRIKPSKMWQERFEKLGKACVTIEMLQNKPHKPIKLALNALNVTNKGPCFIFYNCARLATLIREFERRIETQSYNALPPLTEIDFNLLNQPEEWELVFVFLMRFPSILNSCVCDIQKGIVNPHYLIIFLSNLSATFSVYYRRVKILTSAREHLSSTLHARIHLLKAIQQVFYAALALLDIDPITEM